MKGNASTSLMKTLISKKPSPPPPLSSSNQTVQKQNDSLTSPQQFKSNKLDSIKLKSQFSKDLDPSTVKSEPSPQLSNNREQPTPIGTKFALTMLGLTTANNTQRIDPNLLFQQQQQQKNGSTQQQSRITDSSSLNSNSNESNSNLLFDESNEYSRRNELTESPSSKLLGVISKKQDDDSLSPVASSFSKTIKLNEANKDDNEQINIKKQKLFDASTNNGRKNNVLLKRLLSTNTRQDKSPDSSLFMNNQHTSNRSPSPLLRNNEFQNDFELSPILDDMKDDDEEEDEADYEEKNDINFSSPLISPMDRDQEKELKDALLTSLSNKNNKLNTQFSKVASTTAYKDDIILRTLLNTADLEPQILKLESVFDLNASFNNTKQNCSVKKEQFGSESQNQPPQHNLKSIKKSMNSNQLASLNNPSVSDQLNEKTRKRKKITKPSTEIKQSTPTTKQASKKLAAVKNNKQLDYDYQQQIMYQNPMIKQEKVTANMKKQATKSKGTQNKSLLKQILNDDDDEDNKKEEQLKQFKLEQQTSHQQPMHYYQPNQMQQQQPHLNDNMIKMNNIKEEKIFTSSSLSSSTTSVSSISSLSSPVSNNLLTLNPNQNSHLSSLVTNNDLLTTSSNLDNMQHHQTSPNYYSTSNQQQHMFLNLTNDLLDDFHLTSKPIDTTNETNSYVDNRFYMDTTNNRNPYQPELMNQTNATEDDESEMLHQLEQVFSIQSANINDIESELDFNNSNNIISNTNSIQSSDSIHFLASNQSIAKPLITNNPTSKINQMKVTTSESQTKSAETKLTTAVKDDDLTKQKRIEAISKHLKTDLIESFKSSANLSLLQSPKTVKSNLNESCFNFGSESLAFNQMRYNQHPMMMQQQQKSLQMNQYQHLDDNNVPNLTIDPLNSFAFQQNNPQQQHHHLNQPTHMNHMHLNSSQMIPTSTTTKTNRRMSLVSTNMAPMQQILDDGSLNDEIHQQKRQNFAFNNSTGNGIDPAQTKKKLQERLQRNAANSISSTAQPSNQTPQVVNSLPTSSPVTPMSQISVRTHLTPDPAAVLLASPNSNLAIPPPIYNNNPRNYPSNQFKANATNSSYLNQSMMNPMVPLQKQLTVTPITASPGASTAGQSPTQQSISPSNLLQQQQQHHTPNTLMQQQQPILQSSAQTSQNSLMNYSNNNTNPSQQVF